MADVVVVNKVDAASSAEIQQVIDAVRAINPDATLVRAASPVSLDDEDLVRGQRVLIVEDGPTITHGGMPYGAGYVAAIQAHAHVIVDPREFASPRIQAVYNDYPHIAKVLPAVGYSEAQLEALCQTINSSDADVVISATPCDLAALIPITKPVVRVRYRYAEIDEPGLAGIIEEFVTQVQAGRSPPEHSPTRG
jgi:predicted GTPase